MGKNLEINSEIVTALKSEIDSLEIDDYSSYFSKLCLEISEKYDENRLKSIYYFCEDIAKADGVIKDCEQQLLDIAKKSFYK